MNLSNKIIGISGKLGSGKDYVTDFLINEISQKYNIVPDHRKFAEKVKEITAIVTNKPLETMYTHEGKNAVIAAFNTTAGRMQQIIGTEIFRAYDTDFWIKATMSDYEPNMSIIVSDVRFKNEADYILNLGGILIRLNGDPMDIRKNTTRDINHPSECNLDDYDKFTIIHNNKVGNISLVVLWNKLMNL